MNVPLKTIKAFKKFVFDPTESHFFFFCAEHANLLKRRQDADSEMDPKEIEKCDFPSCQTNALVEFYPNLVTVIKKAEDDIKRGNLYQMDKDGKFRKVKKK